MELAMSLPRQEDPDEPMFQDGKLWSGHRLKLAHSFGIYPSAINGAVIAHGDDAFVFCSGRHIAIADHVRQRVSFLQRETKNRIVTAMAKSPNGKFLAVAEKMGEADGGNAQISIFALPNIEGPIGNVTVKPEGHKHGDALRVLHPKNKELDIIGLAFTSNDAKFLVSISSMPDTTITYWRWEVEKVMASHEIKQPVTRLHLSPTNGSMLSVSGPRYLRVYEYNSINHGLQESPSMFPVQQEKQMNIVDHCWVLGAFLCAATDDGHVHLFEDGEQGPEHRVDVPVHEIIAKDESTGPKAVEKEQAKLLAKMGMGARAMKEPPAVKISAVAPWGRGFVVGGDQGYMGVFKVDSRLQVESFGTFRIPGETATIWHMCSGSEDTYLTILSFTEVKVDEDLQKPRTQSKMSVKDGPESSKAVETEKERIWQLSTFPVGQADLAATGQLDIFVPVYPLGTHHGEILSLSGAGHRRVFATCGTDMQLKVWAYPSIENKQGGGFTSQLSFPCSTYEEPRACAIHPLGFQVAVILEDTLRVYHLTTQHMTKTLFDLPLKHPGDVQYSHSGDMLAVTAGNDVILLDPWRQCLIHSFSGHGGHLSVVNQLLFSENDQMLLSCGDDKHGAIYGWDLETEDKEKSFEHISKGTNYACIEYDLKRQLVVACTQPEGNLRVIENLDSTPLVLEPEDISVGYTTVKLCVALRTLFAGTAQGSIRMFKWPLREGGAAANSFTEFSLHAHSITALAVSYDLNYVFSGCAGGAAMCCKLEHIANGQHQQVEEDDLNQVHITYRHREDGPQKRKPNKEDARKIDELKKKLSTNGQVVSTTTASLDEMVMVPRSFFNERLDDIKDLEERMRNQQNENEYALEQKEQEIQEKLNMITTERKHERKGNEEKYDALFVQHTKALERSDQAMNESSSRFDLRNRELQDQFDDRIAKEYEKQSRLLAELKDMREKHEVLLRDIEQKHEEQLNELRKKQEKDMREWRTSYDQVCNLLKSDGLKFEEALHQQENEYEEQISEMMEHKRVALQVESEKSTTALKDGVSMKQTINMLQKQRKQMDAELEKVQEDCTSLRRELAQSQKMFKEVKNQLQECKRGLLVKDDNLRKLREQMKHLESFRFVLFHKVRALEDERDPLEEQVERLKSNVGDMYDEFVREFRQKQDLSQEFVDKKNLANALQEENVKMRAGLTQLKKDGRRLLNEMEQVLHPDTCAQFENLPKLMVQVLEKHKDLQQWAPPKDDAAPTDGGDPFAEASKEAAIIEEMTVQRDLIFRKNQIAVAAASQSKRECAQDVRRLTSENAALIAEMNTLRNERKSWQRSYKELEARTMAADAENNAKARVAGKAQPGGNNGMGSSASAPGLESSKGMTQGSGGQPRSRGSNPGNAVADTPYVRRKVVDQQEVYRRQKMKGQNMLPPVAQTPGMAGASSHNAGMKPTPQEQRFTQSMGQVQADKNQMARQGFDMSGLSNQAASTAHLPLQTQGVAEPAADATGEPGSFPAETIQE
jgi:WD40 repeat protein